MLRTIIVATFLVVLGAAPALASPKGRSPLARQSTVSQGRFQVLQSAQLRGVRGAAEGAKSVRLGRAQESAETARPIREKKPAARIRRLVRRVTEEVKHLVELGGQVPERYGNLISHVQGGGPMPVLLVRPLPNGKVLALKGDGSFTTLAGREALDGIGFQAKRTLELFERPLQAGDLQNVRLRTIQAALETAQRTFTNPGEKSQPVVIAWVQPLPRPAQPQTPSNAPSQPAPKGESAPAKP